MIKATIKSNGFRIEGHANYAPHGYDIVCAGVSSIASAAEHMMDWVVNEVDQEKGIVDVVAQTDCNNDRLDAVILMLYYGLLNIQEQYPNHLEVLNEH